MWAEGARGEDNERYRKLLKYMEERRIEAREMLLEDERRKREAKNRKDSFALLRLKEREDKWRGRRIDECERIKE